MRQLAWFNTVPVDPVSKHRAKGVTKKADNRSRLQKILDEGREPAYPDPGDAEYLLSYWYDVGMVQPGGMSAHRLSSAELVAWQQTTGLELTPWEFQTLRSMSVAYLSQASASEASDCLPPYGTAATEVPRALVDKKLRNAFAAFAAPKANK